MAITASEARKNLFPLIEKVNDDRTPIEITSRRGDAVLLSRADYEALDGDRVPAAGPGERQAAARKPAAGPIRPAGRARSEPGEARLHPARLGGLHHWQTADRATSNGSTG